MSGTKKWIRRVAKLIIAVDLLVMGFIILTNIVFPQYSLFVSSFFGPFLSFTYPGLFFSAVIVWLITYLSDMFLIETDSAKAMRESSRVAVTATTSENESSGIDRFSNTVLIIGAIVILPLIFLLIIMAFGG